MHQKDEIGNAVITFPIRPFKVKYLNINEWMNEIFQIIFESIFHFAIVHLPNKFHTVISKHYIFLTYWVEKTLEIDWD